MSVGGQSYGRTGRAVAGPFVFRIVRLNCEIEPLPQKPRNPTVPSVSTCLFAVMGSIGPTEIILVFLAVLLLFGAKRIPEIARGLGKGIREFKDASNDIKRELTVSDTPAPQIQQPAAQQPVAQQPAAPVQQQTQAQATDPTPDASQATS